MRDLNTGIVTPAPVIVDEQTKIQGAREALAAAQVGYGGNVGSSVTNQVSNGGAAGNAPQIQLDLSDISQVEIVQKDAAE